MASSFLGTGPSFPLALDENGQIAMASDEAKIRQSLWNILTTAQGERVMRADFGCGIHELVFQTMSDTMLGRVADQVSSALARWEPRIDLLAVSVTPDETEPNRLLIAIDYSIRATNSRQNLVYPFYVS